MISNRNLVDITKYQDYEHLASMKALVMKQEKNDFKHIIDDISKLPHECQDILQRLTWWKDRLDQYRKKAAVCYKGTPEAIAELTKLDREHRDMVDSQYSILTACYEDTVKKMYDALAKYKLMNAEPVEQISASVVVPSAIDATITARALDFLSHNKYKLLFIVALTSYGLYDYCHEKRILKATSTIKNSLFSLFQLAPSTSVNHSMNRESERDGGYTHSKVF